MAKRAPSKLRILVLSVLFEGGLGLLALVVGRLLGLAPTASIEVSITALSNGLLATLPMLAMMAVLMSLPVRALQRIRRLLEEVVGSMFRDFNMAELALVSLMAGLGEELLFRAVLQGAVGEWIGAGGGLVVASIVFGVAHMVTPAYAVLAGFFGLYLGWLWLACDNLAVPIVAHAAYDFVALASLVHELRGRVQTAPAAAPPDDCA